ncbi:unnamed protein product [Cunninghamella blakesleeana]
MKKRKNVRGHYVKVGKSSLRNNQPFLMDDPRYAGQRKSRKDIYSDEEDNDNDNDDDENEDESDDENDDNISWEGFDQQETLDINDNDDDDDESSDNEEDEEDEEDEDEDDESENDEDDNELKNQLLQLQKDEKDMLSQLVKNTSGDIEKGKHVKQQLTLFDNCLESRIRVQKAVELSNQLPQLQQWDDIVENDDQVREDVLKVRNELRDVIDELMNLRTTLLGENEAIELDDVSYNTRKRYLDDDEDDDKQYVKALWDDISQVNDVFLPYRNSTLEKWSNKVQAASSARLNKKFKAFDQNVLTQIDNIMQDKEGLIKRTRLQRAEYKILGKEKEVEKEESTTTITDDNNNNNNNKTNRYLDTYDEEIFDDNDFYQQQLRELIESRMVDTEDPIASGLRWAANKKQEIKKKKKDIDTRASKGRKLRFNVHEKIQNFMAPVPSGSWHESMIDELYSSLLGQRKSMMDNDELVA